MVFARPLRLNKQHLQTPWLSMLLEAGPGNVVAIPGPGHGVAHCRLTLCSRSRHSYAGAQFVNIVDADAYSATQTVIFAQQRLLQSAAHA